MKEITVSAEWDDEAKVWTATSRDVPGLVAESSSLEKLRPKILAMIQDLMEEGVVSFGKGDIPVQIIASVTDSIKNPVAA